MIKFTHDFEKAIRFCVDIEGDVQKYAMSFLHIFNNARENPDCFYKVENCYDNRVFVTCNMEYEDQAEDYLSQFGKIVYKADIRKINVYPVCANSKDYDELYPDDCDTEFCVIAD